MMVLGVDPGLKGGWAVVGFCASTGAVTGVYAYARMPLMAKRTKGQEIDTSLLRGEWLSRACPPLLTCAVVEKVSARPTDGSVQAFNFGRAYGQIEGLLRGIEPDLVIEDPTPSVWKRAMGLSSDKAVSLAEAARRHPELAKLMSVKANDGIAEAILLCHYEHEKRRGKP